MWANALNITHMYWVSYLWNSVWGVYTRPSTLPQALPCSLEECNQMASIVLRLSRTAGEHANINFKGKMIYIRFRLGKPCRGAAGHCRTGSWSRGDWRSNSDRRETRCGGRDSSCAPTRQIQFRAWHSHHAWRPQHLPLLSIIPPDSCVMLELIIMVDSRTPVWRPSLGIFSFVLGRRIVKLLSRIASTSWLLVAKKMLG
jgi:hypothetical protein